MNSKEELLIEDPVYDLKTFKTKVQVLEYKYKTFLFKGVYKFNSVLQTFMICSSLTPSYIEYYESCDPENRLLESMYLQYYEKVTGIMVDGSNISQLLKT